MLENTELTEREKEILVQIATGASNKEIAVKLQISVNTVKVHVRNILNKIGKSTRTEATLYAIQIGLIDPGIAPKIQEEPEGEPAEERTQETAQSQSLVQDIPIQPAAAEKPMARIPIWVVVLVGVMAIIAIAAAPLFRPEAIELESTPTAAGTQGQALEWELEAVIPTGRTGAAAAVYNGQIYMIGGAAQDGSVVGALERYTPPTESWLRLSAKPTPVKDIQAGVIGGKIYVPGGQMQSGEITNKLEIYTPNLNTWTEGVALPQATSAYSLATFEGKLYIFGGWDGEKYLNTAWVFDPEENSWQELSAMNEARGFAGSVATGGRIHLVGGINQNGALTSHAVYYPEIDGTGNNPWREEVNLPSPRYGFGITNFANIIYILGGVGETEGAVLESLELTSDQAWVSFDPPGNQSWAFPGAVLVNTKIHVLGGEIEGLPTQQHASYEAIYSIRVPIIP